MHLARKFSFSWKQVLRMSSTFWRAQRRSTKDCACWVCRISCLSTYIVKRRDHVHDVIMIYNGRPKITNPSYWKHNTSTLNMISSVWLCLVLLSPTLLNTNFQIPWQLVLEDMLEDVLDSPFRILFFIFLLTQKFKHVTSTYLVDV